MTSLVVGSNSDGLFVPMRTPIEALLTRLQAAVTTVDANMLRRVGENTVRGTAVCSETHGDRFL
jgi:hypothetical protein